MTSPRVRAHVARPPGEGAPAIGLVHGIEERYDVWDTVVPLLPDGAGAVAFEMPWDGRAGYRWAADPDVGRWVAAALAASPVPVRVLVAHSFGANAVLEHVHEHPDAVDALVLVSPFYKRRFEDFDWAVISYYLNDFHLILEEGVRVRAGAKRLDRDVRAAMAEKVRDRIGPHGWLRFFDLFARTPSLDLASLTLPCHVVGGERDFASFPHDCRALAAALPRASVEILPGCGHFCMLEEPAAVAASVGRFLEGCLRARAPDAAAHDRPST